MESHLSETLIRKKKEQRLIRKLIKVPKEAQGMIHQSKDNTDYVTHAYCIFSFLISSKQ